MSKILILEDDRDLQDAMKETLKSAGYEASAYSSAFEARQALQAHTFNLMIVDIKLIGAESGLDFCNYIKGQKNLANIPVIVLSGNPSAEYEKESLLCGAIDYVQKPVDLDMLMLKITNVLKSQPKAKGLSVSQGVLSFENITIDLDAIKVKVDGVEVPNLTRKEFKILEYLMQNPGVVLNRDDLNKAIAGLEEYKITPRSIDTHIVHLRKALGSSGDYIKTVRGFGYQLVKHN